MGTQIAGETSAQRLAARLDGARLRARDRAAWQLAVTAQQPVHPRAGWLYLKVALRDQALALSRTPLATGLVSGGGRGVMPWFELRLFPEVTLADGTALDVRAAGLEAQFVILLGRLIPPGGHLMIEYESPGQSATHAELLLGVPPATSYLGFLMFRAGFRGGFKDWYISEGGHEGPRKLQGNKSPTAGAARDALRRHRLELTVFLRQPLPRAARDRAVVRPCRSRARVILRAIGAPHTGGIGLARGRR